MIDFNRIKKLVPLNALSESNLERLAKRMDAESLKAGSVICREGDTDPETIYLLSGKVALTSTSTTMARYLDAATNEANFAVVDMPPRPYTVTAATDVEILRIGNYALDRAVMLDEVTTTITEIDAGKKEDISGNTDWLSEMIASDTFNKLPSEKIASLLMKLEALPVKSGDVVIRQNDPGDYYYVIKEGSFNVSRKDGQGRVEILNELKAGNVFGEESLVSGTKRNASIVAMTDGKLMRLSRADFDDLLKKPLLTYVTVDEASALVKTGSKILDVRSRSQFSHGALKGAINIPVYDLRDKLDTLQEGARYIICCQNGTQSEVAAFLLGQRGFGVCILKGGLRAIKNSKK
ncbi:MAG: cyclic nucleotide-binding domain-containing protein [Acidiferrobacterales bacterium]